jgi:hypothetical protein
MRRVKFSGHAARVLCQCKSWSVSIELTICQHLGAVFHLLSVYHWLASGTNRIVEDTERETRGYVGAPSSSFTAVFALLSLTSTILRCLIHRSDHLYYPHLLLLLTLDKAIKDIISKYACPYAHRVTDPPTRRAHFRQRKFLKAIHG